MASLKKRPVRPADNYLLRTLIDPQLSPDGRRVAYAVRTNDKESNERQTSIWVAPMDGKTPARRFTFGKKDHSPRWSPDGRYLAFVADRGEKNQIFLAPLDGGEARALTKQTYGAGDPVWSPDGKRIACVARTGTYKESKARSAIEKSAPRVIRHLRYRLDGIGYFDERRTHIFVVDVATGEATQMTEGDWYDQQPSWSPNGKAIAFSSDRERKRHDRMFRSDVWVVASKGGRARRITRGRGAVSFPAFSPGGRYIAFIGHEYGDDSEARHSHLMIVSPSGSGAPRSLSAPIDRAINAYPPARHYAWLPSSKAVIFLAADRGTVSLYRAGISNGTVKKVLGGERQIHQFSISRDASRVAFTASFASMPHELYATSMAGGTRETNLSHAHADLLATTKLGATRRMTHRAPDGLEIESFVMYPPGYKVGNRYPLVLYIHGGPHGQHPGAGFSMRPQSLAGAGYVVLLPNPRGSGSYGEEFMRMCVRDWGGKDYEDLMTAVDVLIRKGVADPRRLYVTGYSYGGFMTTWVVGHTDRFKAAIIGAPVSDHISMRGTTEIPQFSDFEVVSPFEDVQAAWENSPLAHLPNCTTPVLIEHHEGDLRCPIGQGEEIFQTLKLLGKEVEFLRYPGGFHTLEFHTPSQDVDYMERALAWFRAHRGAVKQARSRTSLNGAKPAAGAASRHDATKRRTVASANGARANGVPRRVAVGPRT